MAGEHCDLFDKLRDVFAEAGDGISFHRAVKDCPGPIISFRREVFDVFHDKLTRLRDTFAKRPDMIAEVGDGISFRRAVKASSGMDKAFRREVFYDLRDKLDRFRGMFDNG